jgi:hypothetical protein
MKKSIALIQKIIIILTINLQVYFVNCQNDTTILDQFFSKFIKAQPDDIKLYADNFKNNATYIDYFKNNQTVAKFYYNFKGVKTYTVSFPNEKYYHIRIKVNIYVYMFVINRLILADILISIVAKV